MSEMHPIQEQRMPASSPIGEAVREFSATRAQDRPVIIVNPAHGNEPYIMGAKFAVGVSKKLRAAGLPQPDIIVPLLYGDRQKQILLSVLGEDAGLVHLDEQFGEILKPIVFGSNDFPGHMQSLRDHYDEVEKLLSERYQSDFSARKLTGDEASQFSSQNIIASIDTGARMLVEAPLRYYAFPALVSEVLLAAKRENLPTGLSDADLGALIERMLKAETKYAKVFIPRINTFSYEAITDGNASAEKKYAALEGQPLTVNGRDRVYTPPMKPEIAELEDAQKPGIFIMFSGTGSGIALTQKIKEAAEDAGLRVETNEGFAKDPTDIMRQKSTEAIFGRAGWGTGWQANNLAKPWIVNEFERGDDPEIYFNNKTIEAMKLGRVLRGSDLSPEKLEKLMSELGDFSPGLHALRDFIRKEFGSADGIDFVASEIARDILQNRKVS